MKKLSIIIPVYNEASTLKEVIAKIVAVKLPGHLEKEILLIDDGSTDASAHIIKEIESEINQKKISGVSVITHSTIINSGKGFAVRIGIWYAEGDIIIVQDADLEYDPQDYVQMLGPILSGASDVVYGSRFMAGYSPQMKILNRIANVILAVLANVLFRIKLTDEATAYKMFKKDVLKKIKLTCKRFGFCPEVTAKVSRLNYRIAETPISYKPRSVEDGKKFRWYDLGTAIWFLIKYRFASQKSLIQHPHD